MALPRQRPRADARDVAPPCQAHLVDSAQKAELEERDGLLLVWTPFNQRFTQGAKRLGGRWDDAEGCWTFDPSLHRRVTATVRRVFGPDAISERPTQDAPSSADDIAAEAERFLRSHG